MPSLICNAQFLLIAAANFCLFLVVATWSFLPVIIVELGGNKIDVGLVMGSIGITSLGCLPLIAPLIDKYGRKFFISIGVLVIGVSNAAFLLFDSYSPLMILARLLQGIAFAACFNGCATAVIDLVPADQRAQGIGLFGISGSLAVSVGPFLGENVLAFWGYQAYFMLLFGFGLAGFLISLFIREPVRKTVGKTLNGFFATAYNDGYILMMLMAGIFGSGFSAMNTFFPLYAKTLGIQAGLFFVAYGASLIIVRILLGGFADRTNRDKLILACLIGFGIMLIYTVQVHTVFQAALLGAFFGIAQGLSYPAMMARMVDKSASDNRAIVVALFTGSFGVGINLSVVAWGFIADTQGLDTMFWVGGLLMFAAAIVTAFSLLGRETAWQKAPVYRKPSRVSE